MVTCNHKIAIDQSPTDYEALIRLFEIAVVTRRDENQRHGDWSHICHQEDQPQQTNRDGIGSLIEQLAGFTDTAGRTEDLS